jgi:pimeloyl-ACP methyl ester carboxylesterase
MSYHGSSSGKVQWILVLALLLVLGGGLMAYRTQTDGGNVEVRDVRFMGTNGTMMSGLLYVPKGATAKTPAPGILAVHGYINSRETQTGFAVELARRGYVVLALDQTGHGFSDGPAFVNGFGGPDGLRYLRSLDIVDPDNIGMEGHSMGGWTILMAASKYPNDYKSMVLEGSSTGTYGTAEGTADYPRNLRLVFSQRDEFSKLMWGVDLPKDMVNTAKLKKLFNTTEPVEIGKIYGSIEAGNARQLLMPPNVHTGDHFFNVPIGMAIEWFQTTLKGGKNIPPSDQKWFRKEVGTLIAMIGMFLFLFSMGATLLQTKYFVSLRGEEPAVKSAGGMGWWISALLLIIIPILTFFRFQHFIDAPYKASALLPQNLTTGVMFWAVGNGLISLVLFLIWHYGFNRQSGATARNYGITWDNGVEWGEIGKSFLLAAAIALSGYLLLSFSDWLFKTDFRFFVFTVKLMTPLHFRIFLSYLIPFFFFFLMLSIVLNGQLRLKGKDGSPGCLGRAMLVNVLLMIVGIIGLELYQYIPFWAGGTLNIAKEPLLTILGYQFIPILAIVALVSTYFFRKTGHVYVGAFLNAILVVWSLVAGQATHFKF